MTVQTAMVRAAAVAAVSGWTCSALSLLAPWSRTIAEEDLSVAVTKVGVRSVVETCPPERAPQDAPERYDTPRVYFIQDEDEFIKIGFSAHAPARLSNLQVANSRKLRLLMQVPGGRDSEEALHRHFASLRKRGEWFSPGGPLLRLIADMRKLRMRRPLTHRDLTEWLARDALDFE